MAAKIKFFVTNPKGKTKGKKKVDEVNILIRFTNGRQFDLVAPSQKQIKPGYWNNDAGKVRDIAEFKQSSDFQKGLKKLIVWLGLLFFLIELKRLPRWIICQL